jgi:hypothetical protein
MSGRHPRQSALAASALLFLSALLGCGGGTGGEISAGTTTRNAVIEWDDALLQAIRVGKPGPPMGARALAVVHTCMYDAWAAYDPVAVGTQSGGAQVWERAQTYINGTAAQ